MLLLAVAGISIGASALHWFNNRQLEHLHGELRQLESERDSLLRSDNAARARLGRPFVEKYQRILQDEIEWRMQVFQDLEKAHLEVSQTRSRPLGTLTGDEFQLVVLELEDALARVEAELKYLTQQASELSQWPNGIHGAALPGPQLLLCPEDFPRNGALIQLAPGQERLHGYRINVESHAVSPHDTLLALYAVNHERRTARACPVRGALWAALLSTSDQPLIAEVRETGTQESIFDFFGATLRMTHVGSERPRFRPGEEAKVYPAVWTYTDLFARRGLPGQDGPALNVALTPLTRPTSQHEIPLEVSQHQVPAILEFMALAEQRGWEERPWVVMPGNLPNTYRFQLGDRELIAVAQPDLHRFQLMDIKDAQGGNGLRMMVSLKAFMPGSPDEANLDVSMFHEFVRALHHGLEGRHSRRMQRVGAIELQKLAMIYEDLADWQIEKSSAAVCILKSHKSERSVRCEALLLESQAPDWWQEALSSGVLQHLKAGSHDQTYPIGRLRPIDEVAGLYEIEIPKDRAPDLRVNALTQLVNSRAGSQEAAFARALEDTMLGSYTSGTIRSQILSASEPVPHELEGPAAIMHQIEQDPSVFAVWGPPGTGKTTLIVEILRRALRSGSHGGPGRVLVVGPTHVAVDEILTRLLREEPQLASHIVRYASEERIEGSKLEPQWHGRVVKASLEPAAVGPWADRWREAIAQPGGRQAVTRWATQPMSVHGVTCAGMTRRDFALQQQEFDWVILDEAGKAFAPEIMIPARRARRLLLVGDHKQLPPTLTQETLQAGASFRLEREEVETLLRANAFSRLFERLPADQKGMLTTQYRMAPEIGEMVSQLFYDGRLQSGRPSEPWLCMASRMVFLDFSASQRYRSITAGSSQENPTERVAVKVILRELFRRTASKPPSVLVICPYKAQRDALQRELARDSLPAGCVSFKTVDAVQGGEADVVILPMTRHRGNTQFLLDAHRFNVALSRAREAVIILGHANHLSKATDSPAKRLLEVGRAKGSLLHVKLPSRFEWQHDIVERIFPS